MPHHPLYFINFWFHIIHHVHISKFVMIYWIKLMQELFLREWNLWPTRIGLTNVFFKKKFFDCKCLSVPTRLNLHLLNLQMSFSAHELLFHRWEEMEQSLGHIKPMLSSLERSCYFSPCRTRHESQQPISRRWVVVAPICQDPHGAPPSPTPVWVPVSGPHVILPALNTSPSHLHCPAGSDLGAFSVTGSRWPLFSAPLIWKLLAFSVTNMPPPRGVLFLRSHFKLCIEMYKTNKWTNSVESVGDIKSQNYHN